MANTQELPELVLDLMEYTVQCMNECVKESESGVRALSRMLNTLVLDAERISKISQDTVTALESARDVISQASTAEGGEAYLGDLIRTLTALTHGNADAGSVLAPIVRSLQFQDRVRQQMENAGNMFHVWMDFRKTLSGDQDVFAGQLLEFGRRLLETTTTDEEKQVITEAIPGLPVPSTITGDGILF